MRHEVTPLEFVLTNAKGFISSENVTDLHEQTGLAGLWPVIFNTASMCYEEVI